MLTGLSHFGNPPIFPVKPFADKIILIMFGDVSRLSFRLVFPLVFLIFPMRPAAAVDDYGTWQWNTLEFWRGGPVTASLFNELRWREDSRDFALGLVGPVARWQAAGHTSFALGAYYLHVPRGFELDDTNQAWMDLEMLNTWKPDEEWTLSLRTMFENRWLEDPHGMRQFSRHRLGVAWAPADAGRLLKVHANDEIFLDWDSGEISENRAIPVAFSFRITDGLTLDLFPMVRSLRHADGWTHELIGGTHLVWKP